MGYTFASADCNSIMPDDTRKNIKVDPETFDRLRDDKDTGESWDDYLIGLYDDVPREAREVSLREEQIQEIARACATKIKNAF